MQNDNQMNSAASNEITSVTSFSDLISQDFMNEIRQIGITGMKRSIDQIPAPDNGHTAICSVQLATSQGNFSDFGVATPDSIGGSTDAGELLKKLPIVELKKPSVWLCLLTLHNLSWILRHARPEK